jgi:hypothetical protein
VVLAFPPHMGQALPVSIGSSFLPHGAFLVEGAYAISRRVHHVSLEALRVARPEAVGLARTKESRRNVLMWVFCDEVGKRLAR